MSGLKALGWTKYGKRALKIVSISAWMRGGIGESGRVRSPVPLPAFLTRMRRIIVLVAYVMTYSRKIKM